ncbi:asparagine synthase (glutamine-hydrolyzing) [Bacillus sp. MUM 13]|uniref:asparagine synthase (glutamine-hydrolyzing) n=1 Tax=Bacillus sp. MUM 13 TaxID=1678001 RepID=UPI0008F5B542|nr:asparagine synthase (glutamine-hydrolyzing) [Bacillus sp. MUM 13]OIK13458.1 asparagine synthase (glutamine-hydrolyzing) [Bacillus sp. MUM 13]
MCGIAGWINWREDLSEQTEILKKMTDSIIHRGPDADGYFMSNKAALGHRRLIVIDPDGGRQPMLYQKNSYTIALTYNGELYNYQELRKELEEKGHIFSTASDTEVLLHSYLEWQEDCLNRLNGIFAFGIWDEEKDQLLLGRDHLGVKPLFYTQVGDSIIFGSEIKVLLSHPQVEAKVNAEGLAEIFALGPMRTPGNGVFKNIKEVRAGHYITFNSAGSKNQRYWQLESKLHDDDVKQTEEKIRSLLKDTVHKQLVSDVPLVSMLSGGLDSSGLTALAGTEYKKEGKTLHTYSIDFVNNDKDFEEDFLRRDLDEPWVKKVAEYVGTDHHSIVFGADKLIENLLVPMRARDLPGVGELETSLYLLFTEMKKEATVDLSGESADEVFSGYPWFHQEKFLDADVFPWLLNLGYLTNILSPEMKQKIQPEEYRRRRFQEALDEVPFLEGETGMQRKQRQMSYMFITRFLPFMLDRKDRASMMTGFEVRVPFCDYRLVEYLWNVPYEVKSIDNIEKGILRRAFAGILPDDVRNRRKSAYPSTKDQAYLNGISNLMLHVLDDPESPILPLIDGAEVRLAAEGKNEHITGTAARGLLDYLLQINAWLKEYHIVIE